MTGGEPIAVHDDGSKVRDQMHKGIISCAVGDTLEQAAKIMIDNDVHAVVVIDADKAVGVVSQTDIVMARQGRTADEARSLKVGDFMTVGCATIEADTPLSSAITEMMKPAHPPPRRYRGRQADRRSVDDRYRPQGHRLTTTIPLALARQPAGAGEAGVVPRNPPCGDGLGDATSQGGGSSRRGTHRVSYPRAGNAAGPHSKGRTRKESAMDVTVSEGKNVLVADLIPTCMEAFTAAHHLLVEMRTGVSLMVLRGGRLDGDLLDEHQIAAHGYAWVGDLRRRRCSRCWPGRSGWTARASSTELESLMLQAASANTSRRSPAASR